MLSLALAHCDGSGTSGNNVDQGSTQDMAMPPPVITSVAPGAVSNGGGVNITITGTGFQTGATVASRASPAQIRVVTATTITCTTGATTSRSADRRRLSSPIPTSKRPATTRRCSLRASRSALAIRPTSPTLQTIPTASQQRRQTSMAMATWTW